MGEAGCPVALVGPGEAQPPELGGVARQEPERVPALEGRPVVVAEIDVDGIDDPGIHPVREDLQLEESEIVGGVDLERPVEGLGGGDVVGQLLADPARVRVEMMLEAGPERDIVLLVEERLELLRAAVGRRMSRNSPCGRFWASAGSP